MTKLTIPKTSFETLKMVLRAYYLSYTSEGSSLEETYQNTGFPKSQIARSNSFLIVTGFIDKVGNKFKLSDQGKKYANCLEINNEEQSKEQLRTILLLYKPLELIINSVKLFKEVTFKQLEERIKNLAEASMDIADHRVGIKCFIDILVESQILVKKDEIYALGDDVESF